MHGHYNIWFGVTVPKTFFPEGVALKEGDLLKRPLLAETLANVATNGADAFYATEIAEAIVDEVCTGLGSSPSFRQPLTPTLHERMSLGP